MDNVLLNGLNKQRQLYLSQIEDLKKKISAIDLVIADLAPEKQDVVVSSSVSDYPFNTPMTKRVEYIINQGGDWKVDDIVKFICEKENLDFKTLKPTVTMTSSALFKSNKVNARKEGMINIYSKKEE